MQNTTSVSPLVIWLAASKSCAMLCYPSNAFSFVEQQNCSFDVSFPPMSSSFWKLNREVIECDGFVLGEQIP